MVISDLQYNWIFSGMVVGAPDSALRGLGRDLGQNRWAVFFSKTLCYHSASLCYLTCYPLSAVELGQMIVRAAALI